MRVLVSWGSKLGGTEGIAQTIGAELQRNGMEVAVKPASDVGQVEGYDAAIIGGALYANRWHRDAYRLVARTSRRCAEFPSGSSQAVRSTIPRIGRTYRRPCMWPS